MRKLLDRKQGQGGLITGLVFGIASLVIGVIIAFVLITTVEDADLISDATLETSAGYLSGNMTTGINSVSSKIPTVLLVAAIVLILGVLAILVGVWQRMRMGGGQL
jgi:hypothetical protein